jgi:hypothetical protein
VTPTGGSTVADVDLIADLGPQIIGNDRPFEVHLKSPNQPFVVLKGESDPGQNIYDDETSPPPVAPMFSFDGDSSPGTWELKIVNRTGGTWNFTLYRVEVRLHHDGAPPCVTKPEP